MHKITEKSSPTDHPLGKPINLEVSQSDYLDCRDINKSATAVPRGVKCVKLMTFALFFYRL